MAAGNEGQEDSLQRTGEGPGLEAWHQAILALFRQFIGCRYGPGLLFATSMRCFAFASASVHHSSRRSPRAGFMFGSKNEYGRDFRLRRLGLMPLSIARGAGPRLLRRVLLA
jgi:hypothetical protein